MNDQTFTMADPDIGSSEPDLSDSRVDALLDVISESFRIRRNHDPVYVDIGSNVRRVSLAQHQVIFGRRGSGKSCLLVHYLNKKENKRSIYIQMDEHKKLTYPDILIRLLIEILDGPLPVPLRRLRRAFRVPASPDRLIRELRALLDRADESEVVRWESSENTDAASTGIRVAQAGASVSSSSRRLNDTTSSFRHRKLDTLERHFRDYKQVIQSHQPKQQRHSAVIIDDFYLLDPANQPDVLDYLHRLLRDTRFYLKVGTVRHRTTLVRNYPQTVGLELSQDVEVIDLDRTLEDLESTKSFLSQMLDTLGDQSGLENASTVLFNPDAFEALTLASGGVPRDFLTIFRYAIESARAEGKTRWLTPTNIYKGASRLAWQTKLKSMRDDVSGDASGLERLLTDLIVFCTREKKKTAFLISQDEAQRSPEEFERIQQLMDFKLIHVVEPDTSAASGRSGRYAAYTLDFSFFMEPRRRNIEVVEFWKIDEQRRRVGIREAPVYPLDRAKAAFEDLSSPADPNEVLALSEL